MTTCGMVLFDTAVGRCGLAWNGIGIVATQLPERTDARTRASLLRRAPQAHESEPPAPIRATIDIIVALLRGAPMDLTSVALDMDGMPDFDRRVYVLAREIGPGRTTTYGQIAARFEERQSDGSGPSDGLLAREVGAALGRNPFPIIVPCHRVLAAGGKAGGFSAPGGLATKRRLLAIEAEAAPLPLFAAGSPVTRERPEACR
jgi:methylated-DNA-[protein]-cysteine S-methyltransferase